MRMRHLIPVFVALLVVALPAPAQESDFPLDGNWAGSIKGKAYSLSGEGVEKFRERAVVDLQEGRPNDDLVLVVDPDGDPFWIAVNVFAGEEHFAAIYDFFNGDDTHPEWGPVALAQFSGHGNRKGNRMKLVGLVLFAERSVEFQAKFKRHDGPVLPD